MGKDGRKFSPLSVITNHHFFKVYIPNLSSHHLKLPVPFIKKLNEALPEKVILKDSVGRIWNVEVTKVEQDLVFQNGWEGFVNHYCLKFGEFLVFKYEGNSVFHVSIFDTSGCEKEVALVDYINGNENPSIIKEVIKSKNPENLSQPVNDSDKKSSENCPKTIDENKSSDLVKFEEKKTIDAAHTVDLENPRFTVTVKLRRPYDLHIPKQVVIDHGLDIKPKMILCIPNGKTWPVKVYFRKDGRIIISKGWFAFWTENNLHNGDKCIFEFTKGNEGTTTNLINVYILGGSKESSMNPKNQYDDGKVCGL